MIIDNGDLFLLKNPKENKFKLNPEKHEVFVMIVA